MPKAASLADAIDRRFGIKADLIEGSGGVFEVSAGAEKIFSKKETGRFPEDHEILEKIQELQKA
ncbi:MAG: SelT/SelW/SelH family protein [Candidatus Eisenbacteria bacterium]|nr:SelT/SelW/SelH family protein [Candidatus Latescibacterota bacterium]MBD3301172.1 SelT/SelW/SelH family protein [Candidatus Eisenbacteria bacterium]